jgi:hypothetical protein
MRRNLSRFKVVPISEACGQCPFYAIDAAGEKRCFIKRITNPEAASMFVEGDSAFDPDKWDEDCGGEWANCTVLPLLYLPEGMEIAAPEVEDAPVVDPTHYADAEAVKHDPFAKYDPDTDDSEEGYNRPVPEAPAESDAERKARLAAEAKKFAAEKAKEAFKTKIVIKRVTAQESIYKVKADAIVLPTNQILTISDPELLYLTGSSIQEDCDRILRMMEQKKKRILMGNVYKTSIRGQVAPKVCYHAVVAGANQVGEMDIKKAVRKALMAAESEGVQTLTMLPADGGLLDVGVAALAMLQAIWEFLMTYEVNNLKTIGILMRDEMTERIFKEYRARVFSR